MIADDVATIRNYLSDSKPMLDAFERICKAYEMHLKASSRVTDYANSLSPAPYSKEKSLNLRHARAVRAALGEAYMGGPLL